jgi:hypothetical protein
MKFIYKFYVSYYCKCFLLIYVSSLGRGLYSPNRVLSILMLLFWSAMVDQLFQNNWPRYYKFSKTQVHATLPLDNYQYTTLYDTGVIDRIFRCHHFHGESLFGTHHNLAANELWLYFYRQWIIIWIKVQLKAKVSHFCQLFKL